MRIYSLIMAVSITCGGGKGGEEVSTTQTTGDTEDPSGGESTLGTGELPTTSEAEGSTTGDPSGTSTASSVSDPGMTTGPATTQTGSTDDESSSPSTDSGEDSTGPASETSTGEGPADLATVEDACAPDDGAAVELRVGLLAAECGADFVGDALRIFLYTGAPLSPGEYMLGDELGGAFFDDGQGMVFASEGAVVIEQWDEAAITGTYALTFDDQTVRAGAFVGPRCLTMPMCG
jgi:hypothetical protein